MIGATLARSGFGLAAGNAPGVDLWASRAFHAALAGQGTEDSGFLQIAAGFVKRGSLFPFRGFSTGPTSRIEVGSFQEWLEQAVAHTHAAVMIGGQVGALTIARRFIQEGKPVFPIPFTGGRSDNVFQDILRTWNESPVPGLSRSNFLRLALPWISGTGALSNLLHGALADTPDIFISYRRADAPSAAGRLHRDLCEHFGETRVFMDVHGIAPSEVWESAIERALAGCRVGVIVVGPRWMSAFQSDDRSSETSTDYVHWEIARLLSLGKALAPVLVDGASLPQIPSLPPELTPLTRFQAPMLNNANWDAVVAQLIRQIERTLLV